MWPLFLALALLAGEPGVGLGPSLLRGNLYHETSFLVLAARGRGPALLAPPPALPVSGGIFCTLGCQASVELPQLSAVDAQVGGFVVQL